MRGVTCGSKVFLAWTRSAAANIAGYVVFRSTSPQGPFTRCHVDLIHQNSWIDTAAPANAFYRINVMRLETTAAGTWWNASTSEIRSPSDRDGADEFQAWSQLRFAAMTDRLIDLESDDPDADGATNSMEFLCGTDPLDANNVPTTPTMVGSIFTFTISPHVTQIQAIVECSKDMLTWCHGPVAEPITRTADGLTCQAIIPTQGIARHFVRVTAKR